MIKSAIAAVAGVAAFAFPASASAHARPEPVAPQDSYFMPLEQAYAPGANQDAGVLVQLGAGKATETIRFRITGSAARWFSAAPGTPPYTRCLDCSDSALILAAIPAHARRGTYTVRFVVTATAPGYQAGTVTLPYTFTVERVS